MNVFTTEEAEVDEPSTPVDNTKGRYSTWMAEIQQSLKTEKDYRREGRDVLEIYESDREARKTPFNILYSNTETLLPALYNSVPRPVVRPRYKDGNPIAIAAARLVERILEFQLDTGSVNYIDFHQIMINAVTSALVPGRGLSMISYEASFKQSDATQSSPDAETVAVEEGVESEPEELEYEHICLKDIHWDGFVTGFARRWADVPWIAFSFHLTKEQMEHNFGKELASKANFSISQNSDDSDDVRLNTPQDSEGKSFAEVWQIWDKSTKKVFHISPSLPDEIFKELDDPLNLASFFPVPRPLVLSNKLSSIIPKPIYEYYRNQAEELNILTIRINRIIRALKIRGFYDASINDIDKLLESDDNTLLPATNIASLQGRTLESAIYLMPIENLIKVLEPLYRQREMIKQTIYEITGISDILRGSSKASETATAQSIKNNWGTLRLKRMQKLVHGYAQDCLRLIAEVAVKHLSPETIGKMVGDMLPLNAQRAEAQQLLSQANMIPPEMMQSQPELQEKFAKAKALLDTPTIEDCLQLLQNDISRAFIIDIETNSTIDAEAAEDKTNINELLAALSQFLNGVGPLISQGVLPFEIAREMLLTITRRYRFGTEVESSISKMTSPKPQENGEKAAKMEEAKIKMEFLKLDMQSKQMLMKQEAEIAQMNMVIKQKEHQLKLEEMERKAYYEKLAYELKMQELVQKTQIAQQLPQPTE